METVIRRFRFDHSWRSGSGIVTPASLAVGVFQFGLAEPAAGTNAHQHRLLIDRQHEWRGMLVRKVQRIGGDPCLAGNRVQIPWIGIGLEPWGVR